MIRYIYNNIEYTSIKSLAQALGVNIKTLSKYIDKEGSIDKAVQRIISKPIYVYKEKEYSSILQLSNGTGLDRGILKKLLKKSETVDREIILDEIIEEYLNSQIIYTYNGKEYSSRKSAAEAVGLNEQTLAKYMNLADNDMEKAMELYEDEHTYVIIDGKRFKSEKELCDYIGVYPPKLNKYIEKEGNIEAAVERIKQEQYSWNGETFYSIKSLSEAMDIPATTLKKYLEKFGRNADKAYESYQETNAERYKGYIYKGMKFSSLLAMLKYLGVSSTKYYSRLGKNNGNMQITLDELVEERQKKEDEKIRREKIVYSYDGRKFNTIKQLAEYTGINELRLGRYIRRYDRNAEKAVLMIKIADTRKRKIQVDNTTLSTQDLAIVLGIKHKELIALLNSGKTVDEIRQEIEEGKEPACLQRETYTELKIGDTTLKKYCLAHKLNYSCIYYLIRTYGKTPEESIEHYKKSGQKIPVSWIYERYGILLKHLLLSEGISSDKIVTSMHANGISLKEAIENYIIDENARGINVDRYWMREVYTFLDSTNMPEEEKQEFLKTFMIDDYEKECLENSKSRIKQVERNLLLWEIAECIRDEEFSEEELVDLMNLYEISTEEIETLYIELYSKFNDGILLTEEQSEALRRNKVKEYAKNWYSYSKQEKDEIKQEIPQNEYEYIIYIAEKIKKYQQAMSDRKVMSIMRGAVARNVGTNSKVRTELAKEEKTQSTDE